MSEKLEGVKQGVPPLSLPGAWSPATLAAIGVRFRCVDKSAGRDLDQLLLSFAPNDVTDIRAPHMKGFVNTMRGNVLYSVQFNIEGHLEDQKQQMCHAPPDVSDTSHYDRVIDVMVKVARNSAKTVTHNLPLGRVRPRTAFIALTEHVAAVLMQLKRGLSTARVYSDLFKSFAQMHQMQLWEGTIFHSSAIIYGQEVTGVPDFVCLRNNKPVAIVKVYADSSNDNNNDSEDPFLEEEARAAHWTPRRLRTCDNCGRTSTCCSELTFLTSRWSDSSLSDAQLDPSVQGELARDMLATLCRTDLQPYFSNPPRILGVVVEETRVRLASLQVEEEDIAKVKDGVFPAEALTIYFSRPYNILNKVDRTYLFPAFIRLSDQLG